VLVALLLVGVVPDMVNIGVGLPVLNCTEGDE
jgi:hypothetical protein